MAHSRNQPDEADGGPVRSRRALLAGAAGAASVIAAGTVVRATPAQAATGSTVIAGQVTTAETSTQVRYDGPGSFGGIVLLGNDSTYDASGAGFPAAAGGWAGAGSTAGAGGTKNGVYGFTDNGAGSGTIGWNTNSVPGTGAGVLGIFGLTTVPGNTVGTAVAGVSDSTADDAAAIYGKLASTSPGARSVAILGQNDGTGGFGAGVQGSHAGSGVGVLGAAASTTAGIGVQGSGPTGVFGLGLVGVHGTAQGAAAIGVRGTGTSPTGAGVVAENTAGGTALQVNGTASFTRSGTATVPARRSSATVSGIALTSAGLVLATIQGNLAGVYVQGVTIVTGSPGSFAIHLNKAVPASTKVAWFIVN
jgi:hypothetical protein